MKRKTGGNISKISWHLPKVQNFLSSQSKLWVFRERSWTGKWVLGSLKLDQMLL